MALTRYRVLHLHLNYVQMEYCTRFERICDSPQMMSSEIG